MLDHLGRCIELFPEAIVIVDPDGRILASNRSARSQLGAAAGKGRELLPILEQAEAEVRPFLRLCSRSSTFLPASLRLKDGRVFRCEGAAVEPRDEQGPARLMLRLTPYWNAVRRFVALNEQIDQLSREVERRRRAEAELIEQRERLHVTLSGIGDAVIATDEHGRVSFMNPIAEAQTGWTAGEALGRPLAEIFHIIDEETRAEIENPVRRVLEAGVIVGLAKRTILVRRDGSEVYIDDSGAPIRNARGAIVGAVLVFHDISERRRLEQQVEAHTRQLEEEHRRKDEFLAMLGHELRNPLAPIASALDLLRVARECGDTQQVAPRAQAILERQVNHLTRLVDELLDVARISSGRINLQTEIIEVGTVAAHAIELCEPLLRAKEQGFDYQPSPHPLYVRGDPQRLTQALGNLLHNANRYTPHGGRIALQIERTGEQVAICVEDNGIGIEAGMLSEVFELFRQSRRSLARSEGGLGLGLTLARRLVELHGGSISAASEGQGKGSRFTIHLPLVIPAVVPESRVPSPARTPPVRTVLVVDDNVDAAATLAEILELSGHRAYVAHSGDEALSAAERWQPEVVLLDLGLPGMDGFATARALRASPRGNRMLLVALTGYGQAEDRRKSAEAGFDHHLVKPASIDEVMRILEAGGLEPA